MTLYYYNYCLLYLEWWRCQTGCQGQGGGLPQSQVISLIVGVLLGPVDQEVPSPLEAECCSLGSVRIGLRLPQTLAQDKIYSPSLVKHRVLHLLWHVPCPISALGQWLLHASHIRQLSFIYFHLHISLICTNRYKYPKPLWGTPWWGMTVPEYLNAGRLRCMHSLQDRLQQVLRILHQNLIGRLAPRCHSVDTAHTGEKTNECLCFTHKFDSRGVRIVQSPWDNAELVGDGEDLLHDEWELYCTLLVHAVVGDDFHKLRYRLAVWDDLFSCAYECIFILKRKKSKKCT